MTQLPEHDRQNWIATIVGKKGSGKSFLAKEIADDEPRVIVIDNLGEYDRLTVVDGYRECIHALLGAEKQRRFKLALRTTSLEEDLELMDLVYSMDHVTLIVEETSRYTSSAFLPQPLEQLIRFGRHRAINMVWLARRASELHRDLTANSDVIVSFTQHEKRDVEYLRSFMGDMALGAKDLPPYECLIYGPDEKMPWPILNRKYNSRVYNADKEYRRDSIKGPTSDNISASETKPDMDSAQNGDVK